MGGKQSSAGRSRAAFPGGVSTDDSAVPSAAHFGHFRAGGAMGIRSRSVSSVAAMGMESSGGVPFGFYASRASSDPERAGGASESESAAGTEVEPRGDGMLFLGTDTLPLHIGPRWFRAPSGFKCPICSKSVASNEMEVHFLMCLSKPRLSYNDDVLSKDTGECVICLEDLQQGDTIARLPCLCIYHKRAIASHHCLAVPAEQWFKLEH
uniref:RING-type E3 ubiquitin transferase n=1 Tax=Erpetoichthys calabaricus TaxID=27687 RepID=A0A8C4TLD1_ERPCA